MKIIKRKNVLYATHVPIGVFNVSRCQVAKRCVQSSYNKIPKIHNTKFPFFIRLFGLLICSWLSECLENILHILRNGRIQLKANVRHIFTLCVRHFLVVFCLLLIFPWPSLHFVRMYVIFLDFWLTVVFLDIIILRVCKVFAAYQVSSENQTQSQNDQNIFGGQNCCKKCLT